LFEGGHRYALAAVELSEKVFADMVDLCDPPTIVERDTRPDQVAALDRETTRGIARRLARAGCAGFRWWSMFFGEWHNLVIFRDRMTEAPIYSDPHWIRVDEPHLEVAAERLGILLRGR
jgi:hypothetical protein